MKKIKRLFQIITGFHRIHDIFNSYGYRIPFTQYGYFDNYGFQKVTLSKKGETMYHNCTKTNVY